jgi:hypothetical protein
LRSKPTRRERSETLAKQFVERARTVGEYFPPLL